MSEEDEYDSSNAKHIKSRKQDEKNAENLRIDDLKFLMSQPQFRRFMWNLLTITNVFSTSPPDASEREAGYHDGGRNVGIKYFSDVTELCPERYSEMAEEAKKKGYIYDD